MSSNNGRSRNRKPKNTVTTRSGKALKVNQTLSDRFKMRNMNRSVAKAAYLSSLPKNRWHRLLYRLRPKHLIEYWFSREGAISALKVIGVGIIAMFFLTIGLFAYFRKDLPKIKDVSGTNFGGSITYTDRTGNTVLWQDYGAVKRIPVSSDNISNYLKEATVSVEDKNFYKHGAFDVRGIMRAGLHDLVGGGGSVQGGSTITQQLVKLNENWGANRTITRKVKELILSVELEREYSKNDILTGYLNMAPYGGVEYGAEVAARDYFQTSAKDLTLAQASMLAAIPKEPLYLSPYGSSKYNSAITDDIFNQDALLNRQHYILDQMASQGYITQAQADEAKKVDIMAQVHSQTTRYAGIKAPWFVLAAKQELEETYGAATIQRGGWKVTTTLDMDLQTKAEQLIVSNYRNVYRNGADEEAMVGEDVQTGQVVTLVGGTDFSNPDYGQNNYAAGIKVSPGSSFKPYDYATLIDNNNNVGAGSVIYDKVGPLPYYPCNGGNSCLNDYDHYSPGPLPIRYALGGSRNIPAVKAMLSAVPNDKSTGYTASINKVIATASALMDNTYDQHKNLKTYNCYSDVQQTQTTQCFASAAIGDGAFLHLDDHVNGDASLARLGKAIPHTYILKIVDAGGGTVYQWHQPKATQVIKPDTAYIVDDMASDPRASYLGGNCTDTNCTRSSSGKFHRYNGWHFAIKTGTTNYGYDSLITTWSTKYALGVWVGNHTRQVALRTTTDNVTIPLARPWMEYAHRNLKPSNWAQPSDIKVLPAYILTRHIHYGEQTPSPTNDLFPSWYVGGTKKSSGSVTIDKVSGLEATSCTPDLAKQTLGGSNTANWNIDIFMGGHTSLLGSGDGASSSSGSSTTATDNIHNCNDPRPQVTVSVNSDVCNQTCNINVQAIADEQDGGHPLSGGNYTASPAGTITVSLSGQKICSINIPADAGSVFQDSSCVYKPTSTQTANLSATVVDSVLYSASSSSDPIDFISSP